MKKILAALAIVAFFAVPAFAAPTLIWEFTQTENLATGFLIYSQEDVAGAEIYNYKVDDIDARSFVIDETRYRPGADYVFWMKAYNAAGVGPASETALYTREAFVATENPPPPLYQINIPEGSPVQILIQK